MIGAGQASNPGRLLRVGPGPVGRLFLRPPTLTASNFAALWPTEPIFTEFKVLILFSTVSKDQKASSILKVGFALSKWPHLHRAYVISGCIFFATAVGLEKVIIYELKEFLFTRNLLSVSVCILSALMRPSWRYISSSSKSIWREERDYIT